jgi:hypothetical protein
MKIVDFFQSRLNYPLMSAGLNTGIFNPGSTGVSMAIEWHYHKKTMGWKFLDV